MRDEYQPTEITTSVDPGGRSALVGVSGEVDIATAPEIMAAAMHHIEAGRHVTVDLGATTFLDAAGVSTLVTLDRAAAVAGVDLVVANAHHRPVALVLRLTRAAEVLRLTEPSVDGPIG